MSDEDADLFIDSHVHILPQKRLRGLVRWLRKAWPEHPVAETITGAEVLADLRAAGVTHFFNLAYPLWEDETESLNEFNAEFCRQTAGAIPFASLHPDNANKAALAERALAAGFAGFKFHPFVQHFDPWDRRMDELYSFLREARRPVIFHTGFEAFYQQAMPASELERMLKRHPGLPAVFVHMVFPELERAFQMLDDHEDLYLDATNVLACLRPEFKFMLEAAPGGVKPADVLIEGLNEHRGRVMFGSDHPAGMGSLADIYRDLDALPVDPATRRALRGEAAKNFIERFAPGFDWGRAVESSTQRLEGSRT